MHESPVKEYRLNRTFLLLCLFSVFQPNLKSTVLKFGPSAHNYGVRVGERNLEMWLSGHFPSFYLIVYIGGRTLIFNFNMAIPHPPTVVQKKITQTRKTFARG